MSARICRDPDTGSWFWCASAGHAEGVTPSHPPLTFPVYGLAAAPDGPKWLDAVLGPLGHEADGIWLGHGGEPRDPERSWVHVGTFLRTPWRVTPAEVTEGASGRAVLSVVNATMPDLDTKPENYGLQLLDAATVRAGTGAEWQELTWEVDNRLVPAAMFQWAGAWAAFTTALAPVDIVAFGFGVEPDGLVLARIKDGSGYGFDVAAPITFPDTVDQARAAAGVRLPSSTHPRWWPPHPDHDLAAGQGPIR